MNRHHLKIVLAFLCVCACVLFLNSVSVFFFNVVNHIVLDYRIAVFPILIFPQRTVRTCHVLDSG